MMATDFVDYTAFTILIFKRIAARLVAEMSFVVFMLITHAGRFA